MNRAEMEKKKEVGPLYVKGAIASKPHAPPPRRAAAPSAAPGEEKVRALYEYDGAEAEDLPAREGEELVVVEKGPSRSLPSIQRFTAPPACFAHRYRLHHIDDQSAVLQHPYSRRIMAPLPKLLRRDRSHSHLLRPSDLDCFLCSPSTFSVP